jgi:hypothetical protein
MDLDEMKAAWQELDKKADVIAAQLEWQGLSRDN